MKRRDFLQSTAALAIPAPRRAQATDSQIEILLDEPIGTISPKLHGQFSEHIGGVIYDGVWVGEASTIPNVGGIRKELITKLQQLNVPVVRWPGGCFADSYDWRDGIGPRAKRPRRTNFWANDPFMRKAPNGPQKYEPNQFGTDEFMHFCSLIDAEPYVAANVRGLTALDMDHWVAYCNSPAGMTTLADLRAGNGRAEPYRAIYWGVGNESWGCGGNFTPDEYASEFRRFTTWVPDYGLSLHFIGSGPNGDDFAWTRGFFEALAAKGPDQLDRVWGWALHYYCGTSGKGQAIDFTVEDWYDLLGKASRMESLIARHWSVMGETDETHKVKLVVDEWGTWHKPGTEIAPGFLFCQIPTMRDALVSALTLDIFHRNAEKLGMANVAQLINNLNCLFLAHHDRFIVTPNFYVFDMYKAHQGGKSLRLLVAAPPISYARELDRVGATLWGLSGSASLLRKKLVLTTVNPHVTEGRSAEITVRGASVESCRVKTLTNPDIHAHNSFSHPNAIELKNEQVASPGPKLFWEFKPASVTCMEMELR
jgi:alpha-L-arabinofuranosidase